jgi:formylglycine-generating enzyme required for sulfatase activity
MHGNLYQWCQDGYGYYDKSNKKDPKGDLNGNGRVLRGGSWDSGPGFCRAACRRYWGPAALCSGDFGCRLLLRLD